MQSPSLDGFPLQVDRPKAISGDDPCKRLYYTPTLSFLRRCNAGNIPPADSLDLKLGSVCNQGIDWPISKPETVRQPITCSKNCQCRPVFVIERQFDHPLRIAPIYETPTNINNIKLGFGKRNILI
ncbi:uncharacterized protein NPIL_378511 [Nephila pilipes]|uniref:Uncharacterized protein n=1 Tax=Nephila pilipes TaxID=299642 RepID=A0A8X6NHY5_NEPPI|nr:uncharacterized protein NPIL_378511 [Nephila pilipes]